MTDEAEIDDEIRHKAEQLASILGVMALDRIEYLFYQLQRMPELGRSFGNFVDLPSPSAIIKEQSRYQSSLRRVLATIPAPKPYGFGKHDVSPHFLYALGQELTPDEPSDEVKMSAAIAELACCDRG